MSTMTVQFDIEDFQEDQNDDFQDVVERVNRLGETFETAFKASGVDCSLVGSFAQYKVTIEDDRAEAVRELLEWITTANVQIED